MNAPLVSVVIPAYNYGHHLAAALGSVLSQGLDSLEVLILDDASTDNTPEVAAQFLNDPRVRYIRHAENQRLIANCNFGIAAARGDYVLILSADDVMAPGYFREVLAFRTKHPDVDVFYTQLYMLNAAGTEATLFEPIVAANYHCDRNEFAALLSFGCYMFFGSVLAPRELYARFGDFDLDVIAAMDLDMLLRWSQNGVRFGYVAQPLVACRVHDQQLSGGARYFTSGLVLEEFLVLLDKYLTPAYYSLVDGHEHTIINHLERKYTMITHAGYVDENARLRSAVDRYAALLLELSAAHRNAPRAVTFAVVILDNGDAPTLRITLNALFKQSCTGWEAIIVGERSEDEYAEFRHSDELGRIRSLSCAPVTPESDRLNAAIYTSRATAFLFLRAGSQIAPLHLESLLVAFAQRPCDILLCEARLEITDDAPSADSMVFLSTTRIDETIAVPVLPLDTLAVRREALDELFVFNKLVSILPEWEFFLRMRRRANIAAFPQLTVTLQPQRYAQQLAPRLATVLVLFDTIEAVIIGHDPIVVAARNAYRAAITALIPRAEQLVNDGIGVAEFMRVVYGQTILEPTAATETLRTDTMPLPETHATPPLVSVHIPAYNYAHTLAAAIDSVLGQSIAELEIIVLDDASTDATQAVMAGYAAEPRIRYIRQPKNVGLVANQNTGLAASRGTYVMSLSADDVMMPDYLSKVFAFKADHPEVEVVYTAIYLMNEDGSERMVRNGLISSSYVGCGNEFASFLSYGCYMFFGSILAPRALYERLGYFDSETIVAGVDLEMLIRWAANDVVFGYVAEPLIAFRVHSKQLSGPERYCKTGLLLSEFLLMIERHVTPEREAKLHGFERTVVRHINAKLEVVRDAGFTDDGTLAAKAQQAAERIQNICEKNASALAVTTIAVVILDDDRIELLEETLICLRDQSATDWQAIIMSTRGRELQDACDRFDTKRRFQVVQVNTDDPQGKQLNMALRIINGNAFVFLRAGTLIAPGHIEQIQASFKQFDCEIIVSTATARIMADQTQTIYDDTLFVTPDSIDTMLIAPAIPLEALAIRRDTLAHYFYFNESIAALAEWEAFLRFRRAAKIAVAPQLRVVHTITPQGMARVNPLNHLPPLYAMLYEHYAVNDAERIELRERYLQQVRAVLDAYEVLLSTTSGLRELARTIHGRNTFDEAALSLSS